MDQDHRWIARNFSELVDRYGGRCVAVVKGRVVAVGCCTERVERKARKETGAAVPAVLHVPRERDLGFPSVRLHDLS